MAIAHVALLDEEVGIAHGTGGILEQELLLFRRHQAEKVAGLAVIIVVVLALVVVVHRATDLQGRQVLNVSESRISQLHTKANLRLRAKLTNIRKGIL